MWKHSQIRRPRSQNATRFDAKVSKRTKATSAALLRDKTGPNGHYINTQLSVWGQRQKAPPQLLKNAEKRPRFDVKPKKVSVNSTNFKLSVLVQNRTNFKNKISFKHSIKHLKRSSNLNYVFRNPERLSFEEERESKVAPNELDADTEWSLA